MLVLESFENLYNSYSRKHLRVNASDFKTMMAEAVFPRTTTPQCLLSFEAPSAY